MNRFPHFAMEAWLVHSFALASMMTPCIVYGPVTGAAATELVQVAAGQSLAQPFVLLQISANMAGLVLVIGSLHLLYVNTRLLPPHVRPPMWRRAALVFMSLFYGFFVIRSFATFFT